MKKLKITYYIMFSLQFLILKIISFNNNYHLKTVIWIYIWMSILSNLY